MNAILQAVRIVAWRLAVNRSISVLVRSIFYVLCVFGVIALADRLLYLGFSPYLAMFAATAAIIPYAALSLLLRRVTRGDAALAIDQRLGLHERLSTALAIQGTEGPAAEALLLDAQRHAEAIKPRKHFPYQYPREARYLPFPALAIFLIWGVVPSFDLLNREAAVVEQRKTKQELLLVAKKIEKRSTERRKKLEKIQSVQTEKLIKELEKVSEALKAAKDKKEAFLQLSEVGDKLKNRHEDLQKLVDSKKRFQPTELAQMTKELQEALAEGDYKAAKRQLERLAEELEKMKEEMSEGGEVDKQKLEQLAREMERLAEELEEAEMGELADVLKQAATQLTKLDAKELEEALKNLKQAENELEQLERLVEEFEMVESALEELELAKEALSGCKSCRGGRLGLGLKSGRGFKGGTALRGGQGRQGRGNGPGGGGGRGSGERDRGNLDSANFEKSRVRGQIGKGPILGSFLVKGMPPKGESNVEYREAITNYRAAAEDALDKERIPANYRDLVREYFEAIESPVVEDP